HGSFNWGVAIVSSGLAVVGVLGALVVYGFGARTAVALGPLRPLYTLVARRFYLDDLYENVFAGGIVYGGVARLGQLLDRDLVDGIVNGVAGTARRLAYGLTRLQSGQEQAYGLF